MITKEKAIRMAKTGWWKGVDADIITAFQLFEPLMCMDFSDFHEAIEKSLDRPVYTHEFGFHVEGLKKEFLGKRPKATLDEIINLIPKDKQIIIVEGDE